MRTYQEGLLDPEAAQGSWGRPRLLALDRCAAADGSEGSVDSALAGEEGLTARDRHLHVILVRWHWDVSAVGWQRRLLCGNRGQAVILQVFRVEVAHALPLPGQALSGALRHGQSFLEDIVAELWPDLASGWIAFCSVRNHGLHLLYCGRQEDYVPADRAAVHHRRADVARAVDDHSHVVGAGEGRAQVRRA